jgi:hypothetical protein
MYFIPLPEIADEWAKEKCGLQELYADETEILKGLN